jgi:hypothetical protein
MQNSKFYEFSRFKAKYYSSNECMSIFGRQDYFEIQICDSLIIHLVKTIIPKVK